jgi:hypothetical protein
MRRPLQGRDGAPPVSPHNSQIYVDDPEREAISEACCVMWRGEIQFVPLVTVQDDFLASPFQPSTVVPFYNSSSEPSSWRTFFTLFHNANILRVAHGIEPEVEAILRPCNGTSTSQFLPALKEIELNATTPLDTLSRIDENELVSVLTFSRLS